MRGVLLLAIIAIISVPTTEGIRVVLTRHGEKCASACVQAGGKPSGNDLSADGRARAQYLSRCFAQASPAFPDGAPDLIVGTSASNREKELAQPLASAQHIPMKMDVLVWDYGKVKRYIEDAENQGKKSVWVVWEHVHIPALAKALNHEAASSFNSKWPSLCSHWSGDDHNKPNSQGCYDQIWAFPYGSGKAYGKFAEGFNGDPNGPCDVAALNIFDTSLLEADGNRTQPSFEVNSTLSSGPVVDIGGFTCSQWCSDGGHGSYGQIIGTAPFCGASCSNDCPNGACELATSEMSDYGNGCATGNKVCCCSQTAAGTPTKLVQPLK